MSEVADRYRAVADGFGARLEGVADDRWSSPTPCTDWDARQVVVHVVGVHRQVLSTVTGVDAAEVDAAGDLGAQWRAARGAVEAALADPATAATVVTSGFGEQPFESLVGRLLCADTLVHTWDLARATGQDEHLDPGALAACRDFLEPIDEAIRRPGGFAAKIDPADGADPQTAFLNFCGRAV